MSSEQGQGNNKQMFVVINDDLLILFGVRYLSRRRKCIDYSRNWLTNLNLKNNEIRDYLELTSIKLENNKIRENLKLSKLCITRNISNLMRNFMNKVQILHEKTNFPLFS